MAYRVVTELSAKDFARIKTAEAKIKMLYNLDASSWISEDVENLTSRYAVHWIDWLGQDHEAGTITKEVQPFELPVSKSFGEFYSPNNFWNCNKMYSGAGAFLMKPDIRIMLPNFSGGPTGILLGIYDGEEGKFSFGPFFNKAGNKICPTQKNLIYEVIKTFYTRKNLYQEIYRILQKDQEEYAEAFGAKFIADIILLFSAPILEKNLPNFDFFEAKFGGGLFCQKLVRKDIEWSTHSKPEDYDERREFVWNAKNKVQFWLKQTKKTEIISNYSGEDLPFTKEGGDKYAFIDMRLNNALKQMEAFAAFGMEIYEKTKNRILLENI